jgi:hypothetical protein
VSHGLTPDEPIDDQVPVADAVEQRLPVAETTELSEGFQPTEVSEIADEDAPTEVDPADWQEQLTSAGEDWGDELDRG